MPVVRPTVTRLDEYARLVADACGEHADRFRLLGAALAERHPSVRHHYLAHLGVVLGQQGTGLGSALLRHRNATLDSVGESAYLVAASTRVRDLCARHGFALTDDAPFRLPDGGPLVWRMWREPHQ